jgi:hypothetical protein
MSRSALLSAGVTVRRCTPGDQQALLALHREGFVAQWDAAAWRWRFVDNPLRRTELIGGFAADGTCLVAFAGVPLPCRVRGEPRRVHLGGDVVVLPALRHGLAGARLLHRAAEQYFAGFDDPLCRLVLGWAEPPLRRLLVRHVGCEILGDLLFLVRDLAAPAPATPPGIAVTADVRLPDDVDALWHRCAAAVPTGLVRDRAWLQWRYADHPRVRYTLLAARDAGGALRGLAAVRAGGYHDAVCSLVEWLVPPDDGDAAAGLLAAAGAHARALGRQWLLAMFAATSREFAAFQEQHGFRVRPAPHQAVIRSYEPGVDRQFLFEHWQHSMGVLDFA